MKYLGEFALGSIDSLITNFVVISSALGGNVANDKYIIILFCLANCFGDGLSMAVSQYNNKSTEIAQKLSKNKSAIMSGLVTFISFVLMGLIPIIPFVYYSNDKIEIAKKMSILITLLAFFIIGIIKGYYLNCCMTYYGLETLILGSISAIIAYSIGKIVDQYNKIEETYNKTRKIEN
jgi:cation transport ATPase